MFKAMFEGMFGAMFKLRSAFGTAADVSAWWAAQKPNKKIIIKHAIIGEDARGKWKEWNFVSCRMCGWRLIDASGDRAATSNAVERVAANKAITRIFHGEFYFGFLVRKSGFLVPEIQEKKRESHHLAKLIHWMVTASY